KSPLSTGTNADNDQIAVPLTTGPNELNKGFSSPDISLCVKTRKFWTLCKLLQLSAHLYDNLVEHRLYRDSGKPHSFIKVVGLDHVEKTKSGASALGEDLSGLYGYVSIREETLSDNNPAQYGHHVLSAEAVVVRLTKSQSSHGVTNLRTH